MAVVRVTIALVSDCCSPSCLAAAMLCDQFGEQIVSQSSKQQYVELAKLQLNIISLLPCYSEFAISIS